MIQKLAIFAKTYLDIRRTSEIIYLSLKSFTVISVVIVGAVWGIDKKLPWDQRSTERLILLIAILIICALVYIKERNDSIEERDKKK